MTTMPAIQTFNFPSATSGGNILVLAQAPVIILKGPAFRLLAWVYLNDTGGSINMTAFATEVLSIGVTTYGSNPPELFGTLADADHNSFLIQGGVVPTNQWVMLEMVCSQGGTLTGLINGVEVASTAAPTTVPLESNTLTNYVGDNFNGIFQQPFEGMIQSVLLVDAVDYADATQFFAIMPSNAISSWGSSVVTPQGTASITTLAASPSTPYSTLFDTLPPAPTSLSDPQPPSASSGPTFQMVVPSSDTTVYMLLSIEQDWLALVSLLGQPNTTTEQDVSVTTGVEFSSSETQTLGATLGLSAGFDIGLFSSQLNLTLSWSDSFTQTITVDEETTTTKSEKIDNPTVETLGWWWQEQISASTLKFVNDFGLTAATVPNPVNAIEAMTYPAASQGKLRLVDAKAGKPAMRAAE